MEKNSSREEIIISIYLPVGMKESKTLFSLSPTGIQVFMFNISFVPQEIFAYALSLDLLYIHPRKDLRDSMID